MKNLDKYISLLNEEVNGLLLTSRYSRHYGAEYDIAEGVAIVSKAGCRYFTDSRYIEAAQKGIKGFDVLEMNKANPFNKLLNDAIADFGVTTQNCSIRIDNNVIANVRVTFNIFNRVAVTIHFKTFSPECYTLVNFNVVAYCSSFTYYNTSAVVYEKVFADCSTSVNINTGLFVCEFCHNSWYKRHS